MDKSIMKKAYKEAKRSMGVYRITTTASDTVYVGFGTDLPAKINRHKAELRFGSHRSRELQEAWNSFGESTFGFEVLDVLAHEENLAAISTEELHVLLEMWVRKIEAQGHRVVTL